MEQLLEHLQQVDRLERAIAVLDWDQATFMPQAAGEERAAVLTLLAERAHEAFTSPRLGELLETLKSEIEEGADDDAAALYRSTERLYARAMRLPSDLVQALANNSAHAYHDWLAARESKDFNRFVPRFSEQLRLQRAYAEAVGYEHEPYDALLATFDPGITVQRMDALFAQLVGPLKNMCAAIGQAAVPPEPLVHTPMPEDVQWRLANQVLAAMNFDLSRGRLDRSVHPFTTSFSPNDVRLTTRVVIGDWPNCFFSTMHEAGHGLYEQGLPVAWSETPLGKAASSGVHESQSRLWENFIGRSEAFWQYFLTEARHTAPDVFGAVDAHQVYRAVNRVGKSPTRTEADELSYNLHVYLRFEIEKALVRGSLQPGEVPTAWADMMKDLLDIRVADDLAGPLQDIHWTNGLGQFCSYTLGNLMAAQLYEAMDRELGGAAARVASGALPSIKNWLHVHIYALGARYTPEQLVSRASGQQLSAAPFLKYIDQKFTDLYALT